MEWIVQIETASPDDSLIGCGKLFELSQVLRKRWRTGFADRDGWEVQISVDAIDHEQALATANGLIHSAGAEVELPHWRIVRLVVIDAELQAAGFRHGALKPTIGGVGGREPKV